MRSAAMRTVFALGALVLVLSVGLADESQVKLKDAPGKEVVVANCVMCHSLDYIPMNSVFLDRKGWETSVNKMIKVMGAPVKPEDAQKIVDYLAENYGKK
jgi:mono/diheme cytochrome c family protein